MKKIYIFVLTFFIICFMVVMPCFAYTTVPTQELEITYWLQTTPTSLYDPYSIKYTTTTPTDGSHYNVAKDPGVTGFLYNMFGSDYARYIMYNGGNWRYPLAEDVYINVYSNIDTSTLTVTLQNNSNKQYTILSNMYDQGTVPDFAFFVAEDQNIYLGIFYSSTVFTSIKVLDIPLWGNIITPLAYNAESFYETGYQVGINEGYTQGYNDGISDSQEGQENAYNMGYLAGQDSNRIVEQSINGFFDGVTNFFYPFFSMGVGGLTIFSILGLALTAAVVMIVIKIVRG